MCTTVVRHVRLSELRDRDAVQHAHGSLLLGVAGARAEDDVDLQQAPVLAEMDDVARAETFEANAATESEVRRPRREIALAHARQ